MTHLLDTNCCIALLNNAESVVAKRIREHSPQSVCLCTIVVAELVYGATRSTHRESNLRRIQRLISELDVLPFDLPAAEAAGRIRAVLADRGTPIGPNDLQIAAVAHSRGLTLMTNNTREFNRVDGLTVEDWSIPETS